VLDVTVPITDYDGGYVDGVEVGISTVSTMPTVQTQSTTGQLNDGARSTNLIERQAAIDAAKDWYEGLICGSINGLIKRLNALPTIQPEPKEGEWIEISSINHTYKCSECGRLLVNVADGRNNVSKHYPYCHCGAKMRGEKDG
jgi:DNA-directed RNA polymerase subunit RPC12/RpoP